MTLKAEIKNVARSFTRHDLRNFGLSIGIILLLVAALLFWKQKTLWPYWSIGGLILLAAGLFSPAFLKPIYIAWMSFAVTLGYFMTRVILSLLFTLIFIPVGTMIRILQKDPLNQRINRSQKSYWVKRERKPYVASDAEKQF